MRKGILVVSLLINIDLIIVFVVNNINILEEPVVEIISELTKILANVYVSGIICSIIGVLIVVWWQIKYSKLKLREDEQCKDILSEISVGMNIFDKLRNEMPYFHDMDRVFRDHEIFYNMCKKYDDQIDMVFQFFAGKNNDVLLDSVQSCFFINLNFDVLNITNKLKVALNGVRTERQQLLKLKDKIEHEQIQRNRIIYLEGWSTIMVDYLKNMEDLNKYWKYLCEYLGYEYKLRYNFFDLSRKYAKNNIEDIYSPDEIKEITNELMKKAREITPEKKTLFDRIVGYMIKKKSNVDR